MREGLKGKAASIASSASGGLSILGGYQVCHNACLLLIAFLSIIGITVIGMPLEFLQDYAVLFWSVGIIMLAVSFIMYVKLKCISRKLLTANAGLLIAAVPFTIIEPVQVVFWVLGFGIVSVVIAFHFSDKLRKK